MKNYYNILEIEFGSNISIVKNAYRKLTLMYHPDKNKHSHATQKFIEITEAYNVLRDPITKKKYDGLFQAHLDANVQEPRSKQVYQQKQPKWTEYDRKKEYYENESQKVSTFEKFLFYSYGGCIVIFVILPIIMFIMFIFYSLIESMIKL